MKRAVLAVVGTVGGLVLLLGFKTHPAPGSGSSAAAVPGTGPGTASAGTRTVTGDTVEPRWGPVQVEVTLDAGKITKARAIRLPDDNPRDREINEFAVPRLEREALSAQDSRIDAVSGATYTSEGYIRALQS